ncbi:MAG TPA: DUF2235 domain-containing protein [Burkholderiales bacterium]|nr:DUF2235 domain-containing protein [Burkholderiales bacterium]
MGRRVALLFDGTWNNRKDRTNVVRMRDSIQSTGLEDPEQPCYYDTGVGTHWYRRFTGGAFGRGLSENIRAGYAWLARTYRPQDEIFLFGFSRGAYTARSLVGLIRKCGLPKNVDQALLDQAYTLYRDKNIAPDDPPAVGFRNAHSREIRVHFIGVWDTVGALGIPVSHVPFGRDYYRWHDTELSKIVDYAYHAVAIDERRRDYAVAVWTRIKPENREVEQRWFIGAHANVGGGYDKDPVDTLPNPPLRWIQDKAEAAGLRLKSKVVIGPDDHLAEVNDSFKEFMFGLYQRFKDPFARPFGSGVNETVDESVWNRWRYDPEYRPASLLRHPACPEL